MIIKAATSRFGPIEIDEQVLVTIPAGIIGFPGSTRFVVLDHDQPAPFKWLQSIDEPGVAFPIMDPADIPCEYEVTIEPEVVADLGPYGPDSFLVALILTIPSPDPQTVTANLRGPILINEATRLGRQVVLSDERPTRFPIFAGPAARTADTPAAEAVSPVTV